MLEGRHSCGSHFFGSHSSVSQVANTLTMGGPDLLVDGPLSLAAEKSNRLETLTLQDASGLSYLSQLRVNILRFVHLCH